PRRDQGRPSGRRRSPCGPEREGRVRHGEGGGRAGLDGRAARRAGDPDRHRPGGGRLRHHLPRPGRRPVAGGRHPAMSSRSLFERACSVMPGGVSSPVRAFGAVGGTPPFMVSGAGPRTIDADGRTYLDLLGSWGPLILGHAHPAVVGAVAAAAASGSSFGAPTEGEGDAPDAT